MPSELTLFVSDENGQEQQVSVQTNPFTIGRQAGNELVLTDAGLSRRHALITVFNGVAQITDCGSQNGTFLNGQQIGSNAVLKNGDVISIGYGCKLRVRWTEGQEAALAGSSSPSVPSPAPPTPRLPAPSAAPAAKSNQARPLVMALAATGALVLLAGTLIAVVALRKPPPPKDDFGTGQVTPTPSSLPPTETPSATTVVNTPTDPFEKTLVQVIRNISNDQNYPFSPAVQAEIKRKAAAAATPKLAESLRALAGRGTDTANYIKSQGLNPALLFYLALAETNGGQTGDPLVVARQAVPAVQFLRGHFGSNFADQTLLVVAAYKIPGGSKKSHPLLEPLRRLVKNPQTDRNVWFLREKNALSDTAYDFVLRFLAYAAVAQNPSQFALDAPAV